MKEINSNILSDITVHMKYAKYVPELNRRETWKELVDRNMAMHIKKYPELEVEIRQAYSYVYTKKILPSKETQLCNALAVPKRLEPEYFSQPPIFSGYPNLNLILLPSNQPFSLE